LLEELLQSTKNPGYLWVLRVCFIA